MPKILTIDYHSPDLGTSLTTSLKNTGFAVIKNHPISKKLISDIYTEWKEFFSSEFKHNYLLSFLSSSLACSVKIFCVLCSEEF